MRRRFLTVGLCMILASCNSKSVRAPGVAVVVESAPETTKEGETEGPPPSKSLIAPAGDFRFAEDAVGKRLAEILTPTAPKSLVDPVRDKPLERRLPESINDPSRMAPLNDLSPPRLPNPAAANVLPRPLPDRAPDDLGGVALAAPGPVRLPEGALAKFDGPSDLKNPAPLPILGKPVFDRASLDDPTVDFTARSVILETIPLRTEPDSAAKINLPDPFELRETIRLREEIKETSESMPSSISLPKLK